MFLYFLFEQIAEKHRRWQGIKQYARNGWISPIYHHTTWKEKFFRKEIIDEPKGLPLQR